MPPNIPVAYPFRFLHGFPVCFPRFFVNAVTPPNFPVACPFRLLCGLLVCVLRSFPKTTTPHISTRPPPLRVGDQLRQSLPNFPRRLFPRFRFPGIRSAALPQNPRPRTSAQDRHPFGQAVSRGHLSPAFHAGHFRGSGFRAFVPRLFPQATTPHFSQRPPPLRVGGQLRPSFPGFPRWPFPRFWFPGIICSAVFSQSHNPVFFPKPATPPGNRPTAAKVSKTPAGFCPGEHQHRHLLIAKTNPGF